MSFSRKHENLFISYFIETLSSFSLLLGYILYHFLSCFFFIGKFLLCFYQSLFCNTLLQGDWYKYFLLRFDNIYYYITMRSLRKIFFRRLLTLLRLLNLKHFKLCTIHSNTTYKYKHSNTNIK